MVVFCLYITGYVVCRGWSFLASAFIMIGVTILIFLLLVTGKHCMHTSTHTHTHTHHHHHHHTTPHHIIQHNNTTPYTHTHTHTQHIHMHTHYTHTYTTHNTYTNINTHRPTSYTLALPIHYAPYAYHYCSCGYILL